MPLITAGSTNVTLYVYFVDDDGGTAPGEPTTGKLFSDIETGGSASYVRQGAVRVDFELFTQTAAGAHTDGGFVLVDDTNMPGLYRLDLPDAACIAGADFVVVQCVMAGANNSIMRPLWVELPDFDLQDAIPTVNVLEFVGGTVPTPTTTGVPDVNVERWLDTLVTLSNALPDVNVEAMDTGSIASGTIAAAELTNIEDEIWDAVITGGDHNTNNSAGKRLRLLAESGVYEEGAVWVDTVNGTAGTTIFENGTVINPVLSIADAKTIADNASLKIKRFQIINGSSITLGTTFSGYSFLGDNWTLALGGRAVDDAYFAECTVTGTFSGSPHFHNGTIGSAGVTGPAAELHNMGLAGDITVNGIGDWFFHHCHSAVAGTGTPSFDFGSVIGTTNLNMRAYSGGIEIKNMGQSATDNMSLEGDGQLIVNANSTGGTIVLRGNFIVTNNGSATIILDDDTANIADIQARLPATLISGRMDSDIEAINDITAAAVKLAAHALETLPVTFSDGGSTTTAVLNQVDGAGAQATNDVYIGRILIFNNGTLDHQIAEIIAYVGGTLTATISAVTTAPGASHTARMV